MTTGHGSDWWVPLLGASPILDGKYRLEERLGGGAMGEVWRALHLGLNKHLAVKLLHSRHLDDPGFFRRFQKEAEVLGALEHPNIVRVTDFGIEPRAGGIPYLVMEELSGLTLEERASGPVHPEEALPLLRQIASALDHAHRRGVLHCDLKAANVLVVAGEDGDCARLVDFGLARLLPGSLLPPSGSEPGPAKQGPLGDGEEPTEAQSPPGSPWRGAVGTPLYLAPELSRGVPPTRASDLYAFGVLAYRLFSGRHPFEGPVATLPAQHLMAPPPPPSSVAPELPADLDLPLMAPLEKEPSRRPATAAEMVAALASAWAAHRLREWRRRETPRRLAMAALLTLVLAPAVWALAKLPAAQTLEARAGDALFLAAPLREPDPRLLLVLLDDATLAVDARPLEARADEAGALLSKLLEGGAAVVALDLLLPASWAESRPFAELVMDHPERVTLALAQTPEGHIVGPEALSPLAAAALGPEKADGLFAFALLEEGADGVMRRFRPSYPTEDGGRRMTLASRLVAAQGGPSPGDLQEIAPRLLDYRSDWRRLEQISWRDLEPALEQEADRFAGRLVLVGATFTGSGDLHPVPGRRATARRVPGVVLQALAADTLLAAAPAREAPPWGSAAVVTALLLAASAGILLARTAATGWRLVAISGIVYPGIAVIAFLGGGLLLPLAVPLAVLLVAAITAALIRRRLPPAPRPEASP